MLKCLLVISAVVTKDSTPVRKVMKKVSIVPSALTIAGSDSGGGAGIQTDLKTFAAIGVHGASAITCVTAQNPREVRGIQAVRPEIVRHQIEAVVEVLRPKAVKTGMLFSAPIIKAVFRTVPRNVVLIVDPVMVSSSGARLLRPNAVRALKKLIARATLVTPNLHEAEFLLQRTIRTPEELRQAARDFHHVFGCAALLKGGHLTETRSAIDFYYDGAAELLLEAEFVRGVSTHGTGCTYSAAIAAYCALGMELPRAVMRAKEFISQAIAQSYKTAGEFALNPFWRR